MVATQKLMAAKGMITQVGVVVRDLQATMEGLPHHPRLGPWRVYEHRAPALHDLRLHGEAVEFSMLAAETDVGPVSFELIQPLDGTGARGALAGRRD